MDKKRIQDLYKKASDLYFKRMQKLYKNCKHKYEKYSSYDGNEYECKICGHWK